MDRLCVQNAAGGGRGPGFVGVVVGRLGSLHSEIISSIDRIDVPHIIVDVYS